MRAAAAAAAPSPSAAASSAGPSFCAPVDETPRLAVLGALGVETNHVVRTAIRRTWMRSGESGLPSASILARFVLRGINASPHALLEAQRHSDIVFVRTNASQSRVSGPLRSLVLWLECAVAAWPRATLIGRTEEDVWLDLSGIASRLRIDSVALSNRVPEGEPPPAMYWGLMETFHWELATQRPGGFRFKFGDMGLPCIIDVHPDHSRYNNMSEIDPTRLVRNFTFVGPFAYAKGPAAFVSASLAGQISAPGSWARVHIEQVASDMRGQHLGKADPKATGDSQPYEDVWMGFALASAAQGSGLTYMHMGSVVYAEGAVGSRGSYPFTTSTLVWHNGHNLRRNGSEGVASRISWIHEVAPRHHCDSTSVELNCQGKRGGRKGDDGRGAWGKSGRLTQLWPACSGAQWERCLVVSNYTECPKVILHGDGSVR